MSTSALPSGTIMVVTDIMADGVVVKDILSEEFDRVIISTDPAREILDFEQHQPKVLILAFNEIEKSERYYLGLYRTCKTINQHPHRTIILCSKEEVKRAYKLCMKDYFDDYILFWPMTFDSPRLLMSAHYALRDLVSPQVTGPSAEEFAVQARRLAELESLLDRQIARGGQYIEAASKAMNQAELRVDASRQVFTAAHQW